MGGSYSTKMSKGMCKHNLVKTPEGERPLENPKHRRKPNINMDLKNWTGYHRWHSSGSRGKKKCLTASNTVLKTKFHIMREFF